MRPILMPRSPKLLTSWKEIASYLGKGVRTVQRWERQLGLPVRRPNGKSKGTVCASCEDLNFWLGERWLPKAEQSQSDAPANGDNSLVYPAAPDLREASRELRATHFRLVGDLYRSLDKLNAQCQALAVRMKGSEPPVVGLSADCAIKRKQSA